MLYEIADLVLNINTDNLMGLDRMRSFLLNHSGKSDLDISLHSQNSITIPEGDLLSDENIKWLRKPSGQRGYYLYTAEKNYGKLLTLADVDANWKSALITCLDNNNKSDAESYKTQTEVYAHILMGVIFRYCLLHHGGIVVHASSIAWQGKGIIFSAPSGTGKSTHVRLWQELFGDGVKVLNDDTPAIRARNGQFYIFGTPWSGSSQIHCNDCAPLEGIVLLEQSSTNQLSQLSVGEAILKLMPRVFLPYFDQQLMSKTLATFEEVISQVPVYLLQCRPEQEAVELVYECVR